MAKKDVPGLAVIEDRNTQQTLRITWEQLEALETRIEACEKAIAAAPTTATVTSLTTEIIKVRDQLRRVLP